MAGKDKLSITQKMENALFKDLSKIFRALEIQSVIEEIFSCFQKNFNIDFGTFFIFSQRGQFVERVFKFGIYSESHQVERFGMTKFELEVLVRNMLPKLYDYKVEKDKICPTAEGKKISRLACFPMQLAYEYDGLMLIGISEENYEKTYINNSNFEYICNFIGEASFPIKNAITFKRINDLVTKDDLTMAYNRRFFEEYMLEELERSRRYNSPLSLIFLDLDGLREVNNRFGHTMGSRTLQEAASRILNAVRTIDKVVRYGGDEFCIVLPETDVNGAYEVAERVRQRIAQTPFLLPETGGIEITASFGIACCPTHAITKDDLVKRADEAMFSVKSNSKNSVMIASPLKRFP